MRHVQNDGNTVNKTVLARVEWLRDFNHDTLDRLVRPARFSHQNLDEWMKDAWSMVLEPIGKFEGQPQLARAHFLMPNAPEEWLHTGNRFTMYEGAVPLAAAEVLEVITPSATA